MSVDDRERAVFRADLQGLRAVAVLLVLVYHAGVPFLPGGFVGVDVFFVISGFLITGHLIGALVRHGRIDLADFFARRARRILPAALAVVVATVAVGLLVVPPLEQPRLLGDAVAAAMFVPNLVFAVQGTDYLAQGEASLFQHYWSLGVEEQFYLAWPVLLAAVFGAVAAARAFRGRRRGPSGRDAVGRADAASPALVVGVVAAAVLAGSLAASAALTQMSPSWAFFGLPTRAWEFAAGGVLAALLTRRPAWLDGGLGAVAGWAGLGCIAAAAVAFTGELAYPGVWAALPVAGAVLAISGGDAAHAASARRALSLRPMVLVGTVSYSLYLVHQPLQSLPQATLITGGEVQPGLRLLLAGASVPVAWLLYRVVEVPFRQPGATLGRRPLATVATGLAASAAIAAACLTVGGVGPASAVVGEPTPPDATAGPPQLARPPATGGALPGELIPSLAAAEHDLPSVIESGCELGRMSTDPAGCEFGTAGQTVATFGDSHTAHWVPAFEELADRGVIRLVNHSKSSCPSVEIPARFRGTDYPQCDRWRAAVIERLRADPPDVIVLANYAGNDFAVPDDEVADRWRDGLARTLAALPPASAVYVIAETPDLGFDPATCASVHPEDLAPCSPARADALDGESRAAEAEAVAASGAHLIDLTPWFCDAGACPPVSGDVLVYRDSHHVTATFARAMADVVGGELGVVGEVGAVGADPG